MLLAFMNEQFIGNDQEKAIALVRPLDADDASLTVIDSGYDNLVIIAGDRLYRFPRSGEVWERGLVERAILEKLAAHPELPVPKLFSVHEHPAYAVLSSLPGNNLTIETIRSLPKETQNKIGEQIGEFAFHFHSLFSPDNVRYLFSDTDSQHTYANYLQQTLQSPRETPYSDLANWVLEEWPKHHHSDRTVIHDDLHTHNMLFDKNFTLTGVIDFGDVNLGSPEQELRYVYWMGDEVMHSAIARYVQLAHKPLDAELIKLCAVSQEVSGLYDARRSYMHERAKANLAFRFGER